MLGGWLLKLRTSTLSLTNHVFHACGSPSSRPCAFSACDEVFHFLLILTEAALDASREKDRYPYNETEWIVDRVIRGLALFEPKEDKAELQRVPYCENAPPAVLANPAK